MRLALFFCHYVFEFEAWSHPGFAQTSPKRLDSNTRPRIGKVVIIKTRRYKRLVLGVRFLHLKLIYHPLISSGKALLLLPRPKGSSTSSEEHYANPPELTHEDVLQEH